MPGVAGSFIGGAGGGIGSAIGAGAGGDPGGCGIDPIGCWAGCIMPALPVNCCSFNCRVLARAALSFDFLGTAAAPTLIMPTTSTADVNILLIMVFLLRCAALSW